VFDGAFQDIGDDFHIAMGMRRESLAGLDSVFIDHAQMAEVHVLRIVIGVEGKRMVAVEPAVVGRDRVRSRAGLQS